MANRLALVPPPRHTVMQIIEDAPNGFGNPDGVWHPCDPDVAVGWSFDGTTFTAPPPLPPLERPTPAPPSNATLAEQLHALTQRVEALERAILPAGA